MVEKKVFVFVLSVGLAIFASIVLALPLLTPNSFSVNVSQNNFFNISVNNSEAASVNITEVNITLPAGFLYVATSAGTTASGVTFSNSSSVLRWNHTDYVVQNMTNQSFWFNATANTTTVGTFNFTVSLMNNTNVSYYNISITVNDTITPSNVSFVRPVTNNSNVSSLALNISAMDNFNVSSVLVYVYNSAGTLINNTNITTNGRSVFAYINITNGTLPDGNYTINATATDSSYFNNSNSTVTWRAVLDRTFPNTSISKADSTQTVIEVTYGCSDFGTGISSCALTSSSGTVDGSDVEGLECGEDYTVTVTATDRAGNVRTNSTSMSTDSCDGSDSTSSGGGSETASNVTWTATYAVKDAEFKTGYSKELETKTRLRFNVNGEQHTLGVISLTSSKVTINVSSTPQQATLSKGDSKKFDVDDDNFYDLLVTLNSINSTKANITILAISEEIEAKKITATNSSGETSTAPKKTANTTTTNTTTTGGKSGLLAGVSGSYYKIGILGIIVGILIVVYIIGREKGWFDRIPMFYKMTHTH